MAEVEKGLEVVKSVLPKMRVALREFRKVTRKLKSLVPEHSRAGAANCLLFAHMYTLRAVLRLLADGLYGDAFTLLRPMFEGFLHLFNICMGTEEQARRFLVQPAIREWKRAKRNLDKNRQSTYPSRESYVEQTRKNYERALVEFNAKPGDFPDYTPLSVEKLVSRVDQAEGPGGYCRELYDRLWTCGGSEAVHRSLYGIVDCLAAVRCSAGKEHMQPSPTVDTGTRCCPSS